LLDKYELEDKSPGNSPIVRNLGQFTGVTSRSAGLEPYCLEAKRSYSKIPSIFDLVAQNPSIIESNYHKGGFFEEKEGVNLGIRWLMATSGDYCQLACNIFVKSDRVLFMRTLSKSVS
jgi:hypothetical protein